MQAEPSALGALLFGIAVLAVMALGLSMVIRQDKGARWFLRWFSTWFIRWPLWFVFDKFGNLFKWLAAKVKPKQRKKKK